MEWFAPLRLHEDWNNDFQPETDLLCLEVIMLRWALGFFVVALIAAALGFGGIAASAASMAQLIFYVFVILFVVSLLAHFLPGTRP